MLKKNQERLNTRVLGSTAKKIIISDFKHTESRLIFLDYDGTLILPFQLP